MNLQVLVSTMHQTDHSLLEKMNIQSDAIVINQCEKHDFEDFLYRGNRIRFYSFAERGIGLSRNNALMRATADVSLFADDDVRYYDGYNKAIVEEFIYNPMADVIVFNLISADSERPDYINTKNRRLRFYECLKYGTYRLAVRTQIVKRANISFSLLFGGGAQYSAGEDSLFIVDCLKKGLKIYSSPIVIGTVSHAESTWFHGYTDKYFYDKGVFFSCLSKRWAKLLCLQDAYRHKRLYGNDRRWLDIYKAMNKGIEESKRGVINHVR